MMTIEEIIISAAVAAVIFIVFKTVNYTMAKDQEYREKIAGIKKSGPVQKYVDSLFYNRGGAISMDDVKDAEVEIVLGDLIREYTFSKIDKTIVKIAIHQAIMERNDEKITKERRIT